MRGCLSYLIEPAGGTTACFFLVFVDLFFDRSLENGSLMWRWVSESSLWTDDFWGCVPC